MRTQVGIVGAGPAGLGLAHLLHLQRIESVVLEAQCRVHAEQRVRAGLVEQGSVDLLVESGAGERLQREALQHAGIELRFNCCRHRIDLAQLTGRKVTIYGQQEVVKDLIRIRLDVGLPLVFEAEDLTLHDLESERPTIRFRHRGSAEELRCDFVAGCDGFHGVSRPSIPDGVLTVYERDYPFGWLGILASVPPSNEELIYAYHEQGFALHSMRSPSLARLYIQCPPDDDVAAW